MKTIIAKVDQQFIDERDAKADKYNARNRSRERHLFDLDCEFFEYKVTQSHMFSDFTLANGISHDLDHPELGKVEVKCTNGKYVSLSENTLKHEFDNLLVFQFKNRPERPFEVGDTIEMEVIGVYQREEFISLSKPSKYSGRFVWLNNLPAKTEA